jgi:hypothetical protein
LHINVILSKEKEIFIMPSTTILISIINPTSTIISLHDQAVNKSITSCKNAAFPRSKQEKRRLLKHVQQSHQKVAPLTHFKLNTTLLPPFFVKHCLAFFMLKTAININIE